MPNTPICLQCVLPFTPKHTNQKLCGPVCARARRKEREKQFQLKANEARKLRLEELAKSGAAKSGAAKSGAAKEDAPGIAAALMLRHDPVRKILNPVLRERSLRRGEPLYVTIGGGFCSNEENED